MLKASLNSVKGGGSVESDLVDLDLVSEAVKTSVGGLIEPSPVSDQTNIQRSQL